MEKQDPDLSQNLWLLMGKIHHKRVLIRQRELSQYNIPTRQLYVLHIIQQLSSKAMISEIAKRVERNVDVISRQAIRMEKDGLIKRIKSGPKTRGLTLKLTKKGLDLVKISGKSKSMDEIMSVLNMEERQQLHSLLNRILVKLNEYSLE